MSKFFFSIFVRMFRKIYAVVGLWWEGGGGKVELKFVIFNICLYYCSYEQTWWWQCSALGSVLSMTLYFFLSVIKQGRGIWGEHRWYAKVLTVHRNNMTESCQRSGFEIVIFEFRGGRSTTRPYCLRKHTPAQIYTHIHTHTHACTHGVRCTDTCAMRT